MKKSSGSSGQPFLRQHGEKVAFGLFAAVLVACLYFAFTRETYTAEPEALTSAVTSIGSNIEDNDPTSSTELTSLEVTRYQDGVIGEIVKAADYAPPTSITDAGRGYNRHKRGQPVILPVEEIAGVYVAYPVAHKRDPADVAQGADGGNRGGFPGAGGAGSGNGLAPGGAPPGGALPGGGLGAGAGAGAGGPGIPGGPGGPGGGRNGRDRGRGQPGEGAGGLVGGLGGNLGGDLDGPGVGGGRIRGRDRGRGTTTQAKPRKGVQVSPQTAQPVGNPMIVVTARVPKEQQTKDYTKLFRNAVYNDVRRDAPQYLIFDVQRKDETTGGDWESVVPLSGKDVSLILANLQNQKDWAVLNVPEVINPANTIPMRRGNFDGKPTWLGFTFPLPPILGQDWGPEFRGTFPALADKKAAAPGGADQGDDFGLPGDFDPGVGPGMPPGGPGEPGGVGPGIPPGGSGGGPGGLGPALPPGGAGPGGAGPGGGIGPGLPPGGDFGPGGPGLGNPGLPGGGPGGAPGLPPGGPGGAGLGNPGLPGGGGAPPGYPGGAPGLPPGGQIGEGSGGGVGLPPGGAPGAGDLDGGPAAPGGWAGNVPTDTSDFLLRFIDYTVEVGHRYSYRVRVAVENPNHGLPARYLERSEYANSTMLHSPWSEATKPVSVSRYAEPLVGPAKPQSAQQPARVDVAIIQRDAKTGATISHLFPAQERGQLLNKSVMIKANDRAWKTKVVAYEDPFLNVVGVEEYDFRTDALIVDLRGGDGLTDRSKDGDEPSEVLLLDEDGRIILKSELAGELGDRYAREDKRIEEMRDQLPESGENAKKPDGGDGLPGFGFPGAGGGARGGPRGPGGGLGNPGGPPGGGGLGNPGGPGRPGGAGGRRNNN